MYRHILIPTDGSELAHKAIIHGLSLAKAVGAKVTALTVEASFNIYDVPAAALFLDEGRCSFNHRGCSIGRCERA